MVVARHSGWATSLIAAKSVGYTIAVPTPCNSAATIQAGYFGTVTVSQIAPACTIIPAAISHFRPQRSLTGPVKTCRQPQAAGYTALIVPIAPTPRPKLEKNNG